MKTRWLSHIIVPSLAYHVQETARMLIALSAACARGVLHGTLQAVLAQC